MICPGMPHLENLCQNPDEDPNGPWCYINVGSQTKKFAKASCGVPACKDSARRPSPLDVTVTVNNKVPTGTDEIDIVSTRNWREDEGLQSGDGNFNLDNFSGDAESSPPFSQFRDGVADEDFSGDSDVDNLSRDVGSQKLSLNQRKSLTTRKRLLNNDPFQKRRGMADEESSGDAESESFQNLPPNHRKFLSALKPSFSGDQDVNEISAKDPPVLHSARPRPKRHSTACVGCETETLEGATNDILVRQSIKCVPHNFESMSCDVRGLSNFSVVAKKTVLFAFLGQLIKDVETTSPSRKNIDDSTGTVKADALNTDYTLSSILSFWTASLSATLGFSSRSDEWIKASSSSSSSSSSSIFKQLEVSQGFLEMNCDFYLNSCQLIFPPPCASFNFTTEAIKAVSFLQRIAVRRHLVSPGDIKVSLLPYCMNCH